MNDKPKVKRSPKRWKLVVKWTLGTIFVALVLWGFIAYWASSNECKRYTAVPATPMKAIIKCEYGVQNLKLQEIEKPAPADDQLLVRVRAVSVNPLDGHFTRGMLLARLMGGGLRKPKDTTLGVDYAGTVEALGKSVTNYKPGDEVFGGKTGAFAEYICVRAERAVALKPGNLTFEQAAAVPVAGITALQGLRDTGKIQSGQKVLVNGASGGVGTFAVQIAKSYGAEVTGVCSGRNVDLVKSIGADDVIDYTKNDFTKSDQHYDLIFDNVGNHSFSERRHVLTPNGLCVLAGIGGAGWHEDTLGNLFGNLTAGVRSKFTSQKFAMFLARLNHNDLAYLADLMQSGKVTPVIDRNYTSLADIPEAIRYLDQGHARGKVVITVQ
jgi:NADPH:quinone reductase-like Zn-dependent oxidoreductase